MPHSFTKTAFLLVLLLTVPFASQAAETPAAPPASEAPKKEATINIHTDPALSKAEEQYKLAVEKLTPEQKAQLEEIDKISMEANEPQFALTATSVEFAACNQIDPGLEASHGKMLQTFRFRKLDELRKGWAKFAEARNKIDFMDRETLGGHIDHGNNLQNQLVGGMGGLVAQAIVENKDTKKCDELKKELEGYSEPYVVPATRPPTPFSANNMPGGTTRTCTLGFSHMDDAAPRFYSMSMIFFTDQDKANSKTNSFEFSGKIAKSQDEWLPVEDVWLDFGSLNTRFAAHHEKPNDNIIIGTLNPKTIVQALWYMREHKIVSGFRETGVDKTVAFESEIVPMAELDKMASCIAKNAPEYAEPLKKAGFTVTANAQQAKAASQPPPSSDPNYNTMYMLDDPQNPGGCIWRFGSIKEGNSEVAGALITTGVVAPGSPLNNQTMFWVIGAETTAKGQKPMSFSDALFTTTTPDGKVVRSADFKPKILKGARYEIRMPFDAYVPFVTGIQKSGFSMTAVADGKKTQFQQSFPPPSADAYKAYYNCVETLVKNRKKK